MSKILVNISLTGIFAFFSATALARPTVSYTCQVQNNGYSQIEVCAERWDGDNYNHSFSIHYRAGLMNSSPTVYLHGSIVDCMGYGHDANNDGKPMSREQDGSAYYRTYAGGCSNSRLEMYFVTDNGQYDSQFGRNYVFNF